MLCCYGCLKGKPSLCRATGPISGWGERKHKAEGQEGFLCNYFQKRVVKLKNHITSKHKAGKNICHFSWLFSYLFSETDRSVGSRSNILPCNFGPFPGEGKSTQCRRGGCFLLQILQDTVIKLSKIQEAHTIKTTTHVRQLTTQLLIT